MKTLFGFFLRLFIGFVTAKFILRVLEVDSMAYLVGLTIFFTGNAYWFDFLEYRDRIFIRRREQKRPRQELSTETEPPPEDLPS